jgi:membrane associated rhomboid family serine protease
VTVPPGPSGYPPAGQPQLPVCVRHPDRPTGLRCVRCDRPACPECLRDASVGYQCVDCVAQGRRTSRQPVTVAGARVVGGQPPRPVVSSALVAVNLAVFAVTAAQAGSIGSNDRSALFDAWVLWPRGMVTFGEPWRLVTSGFLHYGPIHLALNMVALWIIGRDIEPVLGRARFLAVYALALLGGGVSVFLFSAANGGTAGASGAVWGLMGALLVLVLRLKLNPQPVLAVIAINAVISFLPGISLLGHLGGFVAGCLATAALVYAPRERLVAVQAISLAMLGLILLALVAVRWSQLSTGI